MALLKLWHTVHARDRHTGDAQDMAYWRYSRHDIPTAGNVGILPVGDVQDERYWILAMLRRWLLMRFKTLHIGYWPRMRAKIKTFL